MASNIELQYEKLEEDQSWRDVFLELKFNDVMKSCSHAKHSLNLKYNRYKDILPYDHSRVKLKDARDTDYINANYVECKQAQRKYILAQGPLKNTCEHFWQMIWEEQTKGIVMLNRLFEKGISKCEMYYPNADEDNSELYMEFGRFRVNYLSELTFEDFAIRTLELENIEQKEKRIIYHCHYTNWPDFGEPQYTTSFLSFLSECNKYDLFNTNVHGPSVVHCSAGVGRSGTFVLVDTYIQLYKIHANHNKQLTTLNAQEILTEFRTYRMGLVQTHQQLKFAYAAIIDAIKLLKIKGSSISSNQGFSPNLAEENPSKNRKKLSCSSFDSSSDDDDDDNDDDTQESSARPSTAKSDRRSKKLKVNESHVKNLRELQFKNKLLNSDENRDINLAQKTAVNRRSPPPQSLLTNSLKLDLKSESDDDEAVLYSDEFDLHSDQEDQMSDDDEKPFASNNRDISTVKVNMRRRSLESNTLVVAAAAAATSTSPTPENSRSVSEREKRVSDLVNSIKLKQKQHERKKKFYSDFKPYLIGGGLLLGGAILYQIYRNFFTK